MEPKILLIGKTLPALEMMAEVLNDSGRITFLADCKVLVERNLGRQKIDFVTVGAGLDDATRIDMVDFIRSRKPDMDIHLIDRKQDNTADDFISFTNEKAMAWKVKKAATSKAS
jgi:hypothetical protein